jgi:single-stranded-DNA-specific exonuclease
MDLLLSEEGMNYELFLPSRELDSHGLDFDLIEDLSNRGVDYIITVDCGVSDYKEVKYAKEKGLDVFVIDHHAYNNFEEDNLFHPFNERGFPFLSAGTLVFIILYKKFGKRLLEDSRFYDFIFLSSLSVYTDRIPRISINEYLINIGNKVYYDTKIYRILKKSNIGSFAPSDISRLISQTPAYNGTHLLLDLLREESDEKGVDIIRRMVDVAEREKMRFDENLIIAQGACYNEGKVSVVVDKRLSPRFLGWIAGKFLRRNVVFSFCLGMRNEKWVGEVRSVLPFSVLKVLDEFSYLFDSFGGHTLAGGFCMPYENFSSFVEKLKEVGRRVVSFVVDPDVVMDREEFDRERAFLEEISRKGMNFVCRVEGEDGLYIFDSGIIRKLDIL